MSDPGVELPRAESEQPAVPEGAACALHPDAAAGFVCVRCGSFGCSACLFSAVKERSTCCACADKGLGFPIPWERRREVGNWRAFWDTVRYASRTPTAFFRTPTTTESVFPAIVHAVLTSTIGLLLAYLVAGVLVMIGGGATAAFAPIPEAEGLGSILGLYGCFILGMSPIALLAGPANALMGVVYAAAAAHGTLALFKKTTGSFEDTLRAVSYANAPYVWQWVPLLGGVTWFWMMGVEVVAMRETHRCGTDWATAAVIIHRLVLVITFVGAYVLLLGGMLALLSAQGGLPPPPP